MPSPMLPESRFIEPTDRCPAPQHWHSTDEESTELEVSELVAGLVRGLQPRLVLETGSAHGQTTRLILDALDRNGHGLLVTCETCPVRQQRLGTHPRMVKLGASLEQNLAEWGPIDFAFFDSLPWLRVDEFRLFRQWMRAGTIVAFHDTAPQAGSGAGVELREEIGGLGLTVIDLPTPRGLTLGEVA